MNGYRDPSTWEDAIKNGLLFLLLVVLGLAWTATQ
jgi:hypothetical protein